MASSEDRRGVIGASVLTLCVTDDADAQDRGNDAFVGDILIAACRVDALLPALPISITMFDRQERASCDVASAKDLGTYAPTLEANTRYGRDNATFSTRRFQPKHVDAYEQLNVGMVHSLRFARTSSPVVNADQSPMYDAG